MGGKEAGQDETSSCTKTRQSNSVSCLMLVVFGRGAAQAEGDLVRCIAQRSQVARPQKS